MQLKYSYYWFKSALSDEICDKIINLGLSTIEKEQREGHSVEAYTFGDGQKGANPSAAPRGELTREELKAKKLEKVYERDSKVAWLNDSWIYDAVHPYIREANKAAGWNWQWDYSESCQFTVYEPGGFYSWHTDGQNDHWGAYKRYIHGITPEPLKKDGRIPDRYVQNENMVGKVRKLSMTINLNNPDDYDGGNLKFDFGPHADGERFHQCEEIRPRGSVIVFPSFVHHTVTPITRGTRYSLVVWSLGDPFK
jgi:PKHD-type hydroxylase